MRRAKVKSYKKIQNPLRLGRGVNRLFRWALRSFISLLPLLPILVIVIVFSLPQTPHLRVSYTYTGSNAYPSYRECKYLGVQGATQVIGQDCPLIAFY